MVPLRARSSPHRHRPTVAIVNRWRLVALCVLIGVALACADDDDAPAEAAPGCRTAGDLRLVFTGAAGEEEGDLFGLTDDGQVRRLTDDGGSFSPSFSPDGSRIVFSGIGEDGFVSDVGGAEGLDLHVMGVDGTDRHRLLDGDEDVSPDWSPDGERIAFVRTGAFDEPDRIFVAGRDGGSARLLVARGGAGDNSDPAWSPDGTRLAFVRHGIDGGSRIMVADADGSAARSVLERPERLGAPSWSPDGADLAFVVGKSVEWFGAIGVLHIEDGAVMTIADPGLAPTWSASGRLYGYARAPGVADFSGRWRVAELAADGDGGFRSGRAIAAIEPIGYLYGDVGLDVPRCDGVDSPALTSAADVPETSTVRDPGTGEDIAVLPRARAVTLLDHRFATVPPDLDPEAKLVDSDAPEASALRLPPGRLVWAVAAHLSGEEVGSLFDATTGEYLGSGPGIDDPPWSSLVDLAS